MSVSRYALTGGPNKGQSTKIPPEEYKFISRMSQEANKLAYSYYTDISRFKYSGGELLHLLHGIKFITIPNLEKILVCNVCDKMIKNAAIAPCLCKSGNLVCKTCWKIDLSTCKICNSSTKPISFQGVDRILEGMTSFLANSNVRRIPIAQEGFNNTEKFPKSVLKDLPKSAAPILEIEIMKILEMEIMCNYCFMHVVNPVVLDTTSDIVGGYQCCYKCRLEYSKTGFHNQKERRYQKIEVINDLKKEILKLLNFVMTSTKDKTIVGESPYDDLRAGKYEIPISPYRRKAWGICATLWWAGWSFYPRASAAMMILVVCVVIIVVLFRLVEFYVSKLG